jgi:hypothetical protein
MEIYYQIIIRNNKENFKRLGFDSGTGVLLNGSNCSFNLFFFIDFQIEKSFRKSHLSVILII